MLTRALAIATLMLGLGGPLAASASPQRSSYLDTRFDDARHCLGRILAGSSKDARVSIHTEDATGFIEAALSVPSS
jgi:hypothetical protein